MADQTPARQDGWQCPSCGEWWGDDVPADYCQACHERVVFPDATGPQLPTPLPQRLGRLRKNPRNRLIVDVRLASPRD